MSKRHFDNAIFGASIGAMLTAYLFYRHPEIAPFFFGYLAAMGIMGFGFMLSYLICDD